MHNDQDFDDFDRSTVRKLPVGEVLAMPVSNVNNARALGSIPDVFVGHPDNAVSIFRKRYLPLVYNTDIALDGDSGFQQYIMKKIKREPEQFPSDMYSVQGGKQQLEADLDKEFTGEENKFPEKTNRFIGKEGPFAENEGDLHENELNALHEADGIHRDNDLIGRDVGDIMISGADLPGVQFEKRSGEKQLGNSKNRGMEMRKRWWAATSLYKLRIPKSNTNRSHRTRTALPRFDPILYFIGLGK